MALDLTKTRNIGISAHIDSGKTTVTERVLFYTGKIHKIEEVRGGGDGATMDHMELEKEKGITITSAATTCYWKDHRVNIIDTPGHVDFTVEVERSLRVLDGAVMILTAVEGVQSQSITVDRQMKRYRVPRLGFINKMDRVGANPERVVESMREKLKLNAVAIQMKIGAEDEFKGHVDLITMKAVTYTGDNGENINVDEIPEDLKADAEERRHEMLDALSMLDDELMEMMLEEKDIPEEKLHEVIKKGTMSLELVPVLVGSAYKNKGVQAMLDAVLNYLPSPVNRETVVALDPEDETKEIEITPDPDKPLVALAFKLTDEQFGQLTYTRIYQGSIKKGSFVYNARDGKKVRVGRIVRMSANDRTDETLVGPGDIIALVGVDCSSGDTFCDDGHLMSMMSMFVPLSVVDLSVTVNKQEDADKLSKALNRFRKEDPTFHVKLDEESGQTIISGMGELHLEIYAERIRREYKCDVTLGRPKVAYRETITDMVDYDYKHKKQTGGSGEYGHVAGKMGPINAEEKEEGLNYVFENKLKGMNIPREFVGPIEKGFEDAMVKGPLADFPVIGIKVILEDGSSHDVDSSERAFKTTARHAFRQAYAKAGAIILEPIMSVECETPSEFQGAVTGDLSSRRGVLTGTDMQDDFAIIKAEVPLSEMFGYANEIRSKTQGKCGFSMEFCDYRPVPTGIQKELVSLAEKERANRNK
ncbi:MAG: elongation factor G [Planctomycetes bacterium]|nr:elongation factor G [Planctomycetota bacterium]